MTDQDAIKKLVHIVGSQRRAAEIIGVPEERISRWVNGHHRTPGTIRVIVELIERVPARDWPERWNQ